MKPNVKILKLFLLFILCMSWQIDVYCQEAYKINWEKQWKYLIGEATLSAAGAGFYALAPESGFTDWSEISSTNLWPIDRSSVFRNSSQAATISDILANGSVIFPISIYLSKIKDPAWRESSIMYLDLLLLNTAIVNITKHSIRRYRPYTYRYNLQPGDKLSKSDRASFLSGHTMFAAGNYFFAAGIFQRAYPDSPLVPFVYASSLVLPAITGIKRVQAGVHFPTDIVASYFVGMATSILVIQLHKRDDLELKMSSDGIGVSWTF